MPEVTPSKYLVNAGWDDVPHLTEQAKKELMASTPPYLRKARSQGIPSLGSGAIYPVDEDQILVPPIPLPEYWPKVYGFDVGWNITAALWGAWDRDSDVVYCWSEHYMEKAEPVIHAAGIRTRGAWIRGVVDPAARGRSQVDGKNLLDSYSQAGLLLDPADNAVEAGLLAVWDRLSTGRLKVFNTLTHFREEYRMYRRDEKGKIVKKDDHLMDCLRYMIMSGLDIARVRPSPKVRVKRHEAGDSAVGY